MKRYTEKSFLPEASDLNHEAYTDGCKHYKKGNFSRAKKAFLSAIEYWPQDSQAWHALGNCYDELEKPNKAEGCFRKSLKYTAPGKESDVLFNLGNSLFDQKKYTEAVECYSKVSGQSSAYTVAQRNMRLAKDAMPRNNT